MRFQGQIPNTGIFGTHSFMLDSVYFSSGSKTHIKSSCSCGMFWCMPGEFCTFRIISSVACWFGKDCKRQSSQTLASRTEFLIIRYTQSHTPGSSSTSNIQSPQVHMSSISFWGGSCWPDVPVARNGSHGMCFACLQILSCKTVANKLSVVFWTASQDKSPRKSRAVCSAQLCTSLVV